MKLKIRILILFLVITAVNLSLYACSDKEDTSAMATENQNIPTSLERQDAPEPMGEGSEAKIVQDYIPLHKVEDQEIVPTNGEGISIGMYFKTNMTLYSIFFECPNQSPDGVSQMTLDIYKWDTDYATTVAGTPIFTETDRFTDYIDNDTIEVLLPENVFVPGEYLYTFKDGSNGAGIWKSIESAVGVQSYFKGEPISGVYKTYLYGWYEE